MIDGHTWKPDLRGNTSVPLQWPELLTGTATRTSDDTVVFTGPGVVERLVLRPAPGAADPVCF
ncbi:hypothetical protein [Nocardioides sp.]|uniref:hypothetical protein n=1 Tax=Nocardioides sp. TaxID=35761 RepID=UPI002736BDB6|nr:hypothetical protein [Nocardioides sp.]MDP3889613.1 hypothetical protein [Nocardioides sp.]